VANKSFVGAYFNYSSADNSASQTFPLDQGLGQAFSWGSDVSLVAKDGVFSRLFCQVSANARSTTSNLLLYYNGSNSALTVAIPASTTGLLSDTTNTVSATAGDLFHGKITTSTGGGTLTINRRLGLQFEPSTGGAVTYYGTGNVYDRSRNDINGTSYHPLTNSISTDGGATESEITMYSAGTFDSARWVVVLVNGKSTTTYARLQVNGTSSTLECAAPASTTGLFTDTTHSVTVAAGDIVRWAIVASSGGNIDFWGPRCRFTSDTSSHDLKGQKVATANNGPGSVNTSYLPIIGALPTAADTSETPHPTPMPFDADLSNMGVHITNHTSGSGTTTFRSRINGANGTQSVAVTFGSTGHFYDNTNTDAVVAGDLVNVSNGPGANTLRVQGVTMTVNEATPPPASETPFSVWFIRRR